MGPDLYQYLDYRRYLRDWFEWKKSEQKRFSHRTFARLADQRSPSLLLEVMKGKRNLTPANAAAFTTALKLGRADAEFFQKLVDFDQATTLAERQDAWEAIRSTRRFREARRLEGEAFEFLSHWSYPAIHELARRPDFQADPDWIARTLRPRIPRSEAQAALQTLLSLGLFVQEGERLAPKDASVVTAAEVEGLAAHRYHQQMLDRAKESIEAVGPAERYLGGLTVAVPSGLVGRLKHEITAFQKRLMDLCDSTPEQRTRVVQVHLLLFPLSDDTQGTT